MYMDFLIFLKSGQGPVEFGGKNMWTIKFGKTST